MVSSTESSITNIDSIFAGLEAINLAHPLQEMPVITDEPKIPGYLSAANEKAEVRYATKDTGGQGFNTNRNLAKVKALAEFLERLCLSNPPTEEERFLMSRYEPDQAFIDPTKFFCYSEEQVENRNQILNRIRNETFRWWPARDLSGKKYLVPAQLVFLSNRFDNEFSIRAEMITTGAALGQLNNNHALEAGFLESVERDTYIHAYLTRKTLAKITDLPEESQELVDYLHRYKLEPHIFDAASDLNVPTVITITLDRTGIGPAVSVGARSTFNYDDAIKQALLESIQCRRVSRLTPSRKLPKEEEITSMDDRFIYWNSLERISDLEFWLNTNKTVSYEKLKRQNTTFDEAVDVIKAKGYDILVADATLPEVRDGGFRALKVMAPELHPLYLDERAKALHSVHYGAIKDDKILKPQPFT